MAIELHETDEATRDNESVGLDLHLLPGVPVDKDPTVTVLKGSEDCYVRVMVTVDFSEGWQNDATIAGLSFVNWAKNFANYCLISGVEPGFNDAAWTPIVTNIKPNAKTIEYVLTYKNSDGEGIVEKNTTGNTKLPAIFDKVRVPNSLTNDDLALLKGMKINVEAHAIQAEGFRSSSEAWNAFDDPNP